MQVYIVDMERKEIEPREIHPQDPVLSSSQVFLVRIPQKILFWTREKIFSIRVIFTAVPAVSLDEQRLFTERLARQLATTATASNTMMPTLIGFGLGALTMLLGGKLL